MYFDLQGRAEHGLEQVLYALAREIARRLGLPAPKREAFAEESYFQYTFLRDCYRILGNERLLVLVDEFDVLGGEEVTPDAAYHVLFSYLQDLLIDEQRHLAFVFVVGRRIDELPSRIKATFKSAQCKRIGVLDPAPAVRLVTAPAGGTLNFCPGVVDQLMDLTSGHPYFLQLLCHELFERAVWEGRRDISAEDLTDDVLAAGMELGMGGLAWFWDEFPPAERFILSAIAHILQRRDKASLREIGDTLRRHGVQLQGMEMSVAPTVLAEWEIIERAGRDAYRFRVEFLRRWILAKHSLDEAKRELEQVSARAVQLYEGARQRHKRGDLAGALADYGRALAVNPNHARARLGMGQALFESGRLEAATDAFDKAYRLDPESARDGLVAAHRDLGILLESEGHLDQARPHFLRVLDLQPDDLTARVRMRDSWRATAGTHLASGRWDRAMEAYREALRFMPDDVHLQQAMATLEERHLEAEALQRRREQLERAVLESRLKEEQSRRERIESHVSVLLRRVMVSQLAAALAGLAILGTGLRNEAVLSWPFASAAVGLVSLVAYLLARRQLQPPFSGHR